MKRRLGIWLAFGVSLFLFAACAAKTVKPGAERVIVTRDHAPKGCHFLGTIVGEQGGSFTGGWTSNKNLAVGAMNDLKNKAYDMGANYVVLETNNAGQTQSGSSWGFSGHETDVTNMGNAYHCNPKAIGLE